MASAKELISIRKRLVSPPTKGLIGLLTPEQRKFALEYKGDVTLTSKIDDLP